MTNPTAPLLSESEVSEIEARFTNRLKIGYLETAIGHMRGGQESITLITVDVPALIRDWRALSEMVYVPQILPDDEPLTYRDEAERLLRQNAALREQLAETLHYFKSGSEGRCVTCGNLKLWQYHIDEESDPAASMRSLCVEKVKAMREGWQSRLDDADEFSAVETVMSSRTYAADQIVTELQSLTLDQVEQKTK